ncbi:hypothetical protein DPEC_G00042170 [Dallia pectoralis]|uniref:Uncharacterized protein n=1 Tax=Dallia pectoralis TaxID=75939 RepID=A0ACC2H9J3_DALPE|nr:hypothetical protein DPEC_G00042170 [Dallia pectoralis]
MVEGVAPTLGSKAKGGTVQRSRAGSLSLQCMSPVLIPQLLLPPPLEWLTEGFPAPHPVPPLQNSAFICVKSTSRGLPLYLPLRIWQVLMSVWLVTSWMGTF